jgi:putative MATE family efflux protein
LAGVACGDAVLRWSSEFLLSHPLLTAPIGRSLLRLAGPTTGLMVVQVLVGATDIYFVGLLGTDALAAIALVFPFQMLMQNIAMGGMGGGVASALARALGGGRLDDARALVVHALILAVVLAAAFAGLAWSAAPWLYRAMGGVGASLEAAVAYSHVWFVGAFLLWASAFLGALMRGGGDAATPGLYGLVLSLAYVPIAAVLALGIGAWPGLGLIGLAVASIVTTGATVALLARALWSGRLGFVPAVHGIRLQRRLFTEVLRVGIPGSFTTVTANVAAMVVTGLVGQFGIAALAGYGIGLRLEFMVAPLAFGIGTGLTTLVGVAAGAAAWQRAVRVAWTGGLASFGLAGAIGWTVALLPESWALLFTTDSAAVAASVSYTIRVAPFYCLFGLGLTLSFASQGAGRMTMPVVAGIVRMAIATLGGWFAVETMRMGVGGVFLAIAAGMAAYGCLIAGSLLIAPWRADIVR